MLDLIVWALNCIVSYLLLDSGHPWLAGVVPSAIVTVYVMIITERWTYFNRLIAIGQTKLAKLAILLNLIQCIAYFFIFGTWDVITALVIAAVLQLGLTWFTIHKAGHFYY